MMPPRRPVSRLERVRYGLAGIGALMCLLPLSQLVMVPVSPLASLVGGLAGLANAALAALGPRWRGRRDAVLIPAAAVLVVLTGVTAYDPTAMVGICVGITVATTMYASRRGILLRQAALLTAVVLSAVLSTSPARDETWTVLDTLAASPSVPIFAGLIFLLREGLRGQATTIARESFMATLSSDLLAADSVPQIARAMVRSNRTMPGLSPGLIILETVRIGPGDPGPTGGARVVGAHGAVAGEYPEIIPPDTLTELPPIGVERFMPLVAGSPLLTARGLPPRRWHAVALARQPGAQVDLVLHGVRVSLGQKLFGVLSPEETEFLDILALRTRHWRSAMTRAETRATLLEAEQRDDVTGLPDRPAVMRRLIELIHGEDDRLALVVLQLVGLDAVEAERGLAAADTAMEQLALRVRDVVGERGYPARSGDASFAVLVSGADDYDELEDLVGRLEDALLEPVLLPGGPVRLELRTGLARTTELTEPQGNTAADLLQRAVAGTVQQPSPAREART